MADFKTQAPYPQDIAEFDDLPGALRKYILHGYPADDLLSDPAAIIVTQGSCFASNVASSLARLGARVAHLNVNEVINTTLANAAFFEHIFRRSECDPMISRLFESMVTPQTVAEFRDLVARCRAFVLTIGVAPLWFQKGSDKPLLQPDKARMGDFEMRTTTPAWNADNIRRILGAIRTVNPGARIFLTLSPAPLNWSFEFPSTMVADCLSKSVLRVAIHEVLRDNPPEVRYWPSFEVVRWMGSHLGPVFGAEDRHPRHVSNFLVDEIVKAFIELHGGRAGAGDGRTEPFDNTGPFKLARNF